MDTGCPKRKAESRKINLYLPKFAETNPDLSENFYVASNIYSRTTWSQNKIPEFKLFQSFIGILCVFLNYFS